MFQEFFGFAQLPFSRTIATSDLFPTAGQKELAARLNYLVRERGFGLVTGDTLAPRLRAAQVQVSARASPPPCGRSPPASIPTATSCSIWLTRPRASPASTAISCWPWATSRPHLHHRQVRVSRPRMITRLRQAFTDLATTKRRLPLVILDEAHLLEPALLEPLRLLFSDQMREAASPWPPSSWSASPRCIARFTSRSMKPSTNA